MTGFLEWLLESKQLNENQAQYLLVTFAQAKEYLESHDSLKDTNITLDDVKALYDYSIEHSKTKADAKRYLDGRPEPIVADYAGKTGCFALRDWTAKVEKNVFDASKITRKAAGSKTKNNLFCGFHNTMLRTGETTATPNTMNPSAQDFESLICLAYNVKNDALNSKEAKGLTEAEEIRKQLKTGTLTEDKISESDLAKQFYLEHKEQLDACVEPLFEEPAVKQSSGVRLDKLDADAKSSDTWQEIGTIAGDDKSKLRPDSTPKTDIISSNNKLRISLKKSAGAQLMSGKQNEAVATIITALYRTFKHNESKWPKAIQDFKKTLTTSRWATIKSEAKLKIAELKRKKDPTPEEKEMLDAVKQGEQQIGAVRNTLLELIATNKQFENNLLYEAITGNTKFGGKFDEVSAAKPVANYLLTWSMEDANANHVYTVSDYIKHLQNKVRPKYSFSYKTSGKTAYIAFRIEI